MKQTRARFGFTPTLLGSIVVAAGLAYTLLPTSPEDVAVEPQASQNPSVVEHETEEAHTPIHLSVSAKEPGVAPSLHHDTRETTPEADPDFDSMRAAQHQQVQYLKEINPDNLMIPTEKTELEVEQMLAEMERHRELQQRIDENTASDEERQQYVALHRQKLQQELELIQLCEDVVANSLETEEIHQAQLCTRIVEAREQRLQVIEASLLALDELLTTRMD